MANNIKKSLRLLQVEKMVIILKELDNIQNILDFFNGYEEDEDSKKPIKRNIFFLKQDIKALQKEIKKLSYINEDLKATQSDLFAIQYDYIRTQIEDMLRVIQALYKKMQQLFGETLNQYLPYPVLGRRYSNNGIMMYLGNYYREMLKSFSLGNKPSNNLILGWNYGTGFQYKIFINREIKRENYNSDIYNDYIDLPYWYYELPMLLPSITHEVAYISLRNPTKEIKEPYEALKKDLTTLLTDKSNNFIQKVQDLIGFEEYGEDLSKVIFCDVLGKLTHDNAYLSALFHNIIGEKLSKDYLKVIHDDSKEEPQEINKLYSNEWTFMQKKDHSILRLHFLLALSPEHPEQEEMLRIVNSLMPLRESTKTIYHTGFETLYHHNHPNLRTSYLAVQNYLKQLLTLFLLWEEKNHEKLKQIYILDNSPQFDKLWKERYDTQNSKKDMVVHQNNFRRNIHINQSKIEYLENQDNSIIYLLELGKARKDVKKNPNGTVDIDSRIEINIDKKSKCSKKEEIKLLYSVYGIYDWLILKEKESTIDITAKLQELITQTDEKEEQKKNSLKFFKTKQVLMKIHEGFDGNNREEDEKKFSVVFNIEIEKKVELSSCSNGYRDLNDSIEKIAQHLHCHGKKFNYHRADIYKSLGPKDITLIVQQASLEYIFQLMEKLNNECGILRTFTMLCSEFKSKPKIEEGFSLISYIRTVNNFNSEKIDLLKDKTLMQSLNKITGVMDYRIHWRKEVSIVQVIDFYNQLLQASLLTDFQTKIEKEITLE